MYLKGGSVPKNEQYYVIRSNKKPGEFHADVRKWTPRKLVHAMTSQKFHAKTDHLEKILGE